MPNSRWSIRAWLVPAIFVGLAALLTWPWTLWVMQAAYERDVNEKVDRLAQRVKLHLSMPSSWTSAQNVLDPLKTELFGDNTVQAVWFYDFTRQLRVYVRRDETVIVPRNLEEINRMLYADPNSYRKKFTLESKSGLAGVIYLDLSIPELRKHFWVVEGPLIWKVGFQTFFAFVVVSVAGILAYRQWGTAERQRERAELEQQGLQAERGLTAAVLAHEIRNPLAALRFQLHSLRRNAADSARVGATADTIDAELMRIQQLLQDYLAHEKAQAMHVAPVELGEAARGLHKLMDELLRESETRLTIVESAQKVVAACDPHALRQVLMNLVLNAQQAMGRGGTITLTIGQVDGYGTIAVSDNGPGIPEEMRERLFKPFATSKKEGSGIGLALVKRFVDNFGGSVAVESEPGKGATISLRLPLMAPVLSAGQEQAVGVTT